VKLIINLKRLSNEHLLDIWKNQKGEFYHKNGFYFNEKCYYTENYKFNHVEYDCHRGDESWFAHPNEIGRYENGDYIHMDEVFDEVCERGLWEEMDNE